MRIRSINIKHWRHFRDLQLEVAPEANLVCVVGANGTGKTHLLELIGAGAHKIGLSRGTEVPRGDPFADEHDFSLSFSLPPGVSPTVDALDPEGIGLSGWDRTLVLESQKSGSSHKLSIRAGGVEDVNQASQLFSVVSAALQSSQEVHFVSLDADRAYPRKTLNSNEVAQAYDIDWDGVEYTRGRSFRSTTTLYDEWLKFLLARENQAGAALMKEFRNARLRNEQEPEFVDHFDAYKESLRSVLPHLIFTGVDPKRRTLLFDTTGLELNFNQLSGGEREIAFLVGQIDRFALRKGLFLLDEPELHLNGDLIRSWVQFLTGTVQTGQVWLSTHSLEAVEAAGPEATFVLERNPSSREVNSVARLDERPVLSALSRAVGSPAFSITQLAFIYVEGEESLGERERFRRLSGSPSQVRFIECGSCKEVTRRRDAIRDLGVQSATPIRVGGIIDRDFRLPGEIESLESNGIHILAVHEVENLFLHPDTLRCLLEQNGRSQLDPNDLIRRGSEQYAGSWIFQYAMSRDQAASLPAIADGCKDLAKGKTWTSFCDGKTDVIGDVVAAAKLQLEPSKRLEKLLGIAKSSFERALDSKTLWQICEGKQVLGRIFGEVGFSSPGTLMAAAYHLWEQRPDLVPDEVLQLRTYVTGVASAR